MLQLLTKIMKVVSHAAVCPVFIPGQNLFDNRFMLAIGTLNATLHGDQAETDPVPLFIEFPDDP
jgi:hypothetical protein